MGSFHADCNSLRHLRQWYLTSATSAWYVWVHPVPRRHHQCLHSIWRDKLWSCKLFTNCIHLPPSTTGRFLLSSDSEFSSYPALGRPPLASHNFDIFFVFGGILEFVIVILYTVHHLLLVYRFCTYIYRYLLCIIFRWHWQWPRKYAPVLFYRTE